MAERQYPLATLVVLFYRHGQFVPDTVAGALSQTYPNLEIIFSDDNSPDNTFEAIQDAVKDYTGPHKIILNKNEKNLGLIPHVNKTLFELAHGDYFFLNGGDDISLPERVSLGMEYFLSDPSIMAVTGSYLTIDKNGREIGKSIVSRDTILKIDDTEYLRSDSFMTGGVAFSFRKKVLDTFGKLNNDCQTEDSVLRFRSILMGPTLRSAHLFLKYRVHDNNLSKDLLKLRTRGIASQYLADLTLFKDSLSASLYLSLVKKIEYYTKTRELQERKMRFPKPIRLFFACKYHCLRLSYLRSIEKNECLRPQ